MSQPLIFTIGDIFLAAFIFDTLKPVIEMAEFKHRFLSLAKSTTLW
jgi:hypothetical protein